MAEDQDKLHELFITFAIQYGLGPGVVIALPALFERAAKELDMSIIELAERTVKNKDLGEYMAEMADKVSAEFWANGGDDQFRR